MLKTMVMTSIGWMKIGLPLQTFKIVLYGKVDKRGNFAMRNATRECIETFKSIVETTTQTRPKDMVSYTYLGSYKHVMNASQNLIIIIVIILKIHLTTQ